MNTIRKISTLAFLSILAVAGSTPARLSPPVLEYSEIDAYIEAQMRAWNIPGTALVIVRDGQVAHLKTFGQAGKDRPVTPQTPFEIGSCSKSFTALAIMQLVEAGQVDLNAPAQVYLPWFRVADAEASGGITVRHLLNHTSGLSNEIDARAWINPRGLSLEDWGRSLQRVQLSTTPGTHYQYSNFNYMLLALVIEAVSGQSYGAYLSQHIFSPLNMHNSFTDPAMARAYGLADGYTWWFGKPLRSLEKPRPDMLGAGYIMVSPEDMTHYLSMQLNGGSYENIRLLSAEGITAMHTPPQLPTESSLYGMGWVNYQEGGQTIINHNGRSASFTSSIFLLPELRLGIAVMVNVSSTLAPHAAWSMAYNVKNWIVSGQQAQVDPNFRDFYLPWVSGFLGTTVVVLWRLSRPLDLSKKSGSPHTKRRTILSLGFDALLALAALFGQPLALGWHKWRGLFVYQPDAAYWCLIVGILLSGKLLLRLVGIVLGSRKIRS
jgi:CubicO group peptidase (beta-lactamase class C family)